MMFITKLIGEYSIEIIIKTNRYRLEQSINEARSQPARFQQILTEIDKNIFYSIIWRTHLKNWIWTVHLTTIRSISHRPFLTIHSRKHNRSFAVIVMTQKLELSFFLYFIQPPTLFARTYEWKSTYNWMKNCLNVLSFFTILEIFQVFEKLNTPSKIKIRVYSIFVEI